MEKEIQKNLDISQREKISINKIENKTLTLREEVQELLEQFKLREDENNFDMSNIWNIEELHNKIKIILQKVLLL